MTALDIVKATIARMEQANKEDLTGLCEEMNRDTLLSFKALLAQLEKERDGS